MGSGGRKVGMFFGRRVESERDHVGRGGWC